MCIRDRVGEELEQEFGIPIINKRIAVTPISLVAGSSMDEDYIEYGKVLDRAAQEVGVNFIGGFSALVHKGYTKGDEILIKSIPHVLKETERVCASVNVGSTKAGINMKAVKEMGEIIKKTAILTQNRDSICLLYTSFHSTYSIYSQEVRGKIDSYYSALFT